MQRVVVFLYLSYEIHLFIFDHDFSNRWLHNSTVLIMIVGCCWLIPYIYSLLTLSSTIWCCCDVVLESESIDMILFFSVIRVCLLQKNSHLMIPKPQAGRLGWFDVDGRFSLNDPVWVGCLDAGWRILFLVDVFLD